MTAEDFIVVADSVLCTKKMGIADLQRALTGLISAKHQRLLEKCDPRSQSGTETITRLRLRAANYKVVVQPRIPGVGHSDLRIGKLILECDSKQHHTNLEDYERDRWRDRKSLLAGFVTIRLTYSMVIHQWAEVFADIQAFTRADRHRKRC
ncbi:endonuclease domain-containing protein [Gordonia sp. (in: high G+C Gram-positive bacteria)]|uniref:endonuclease domain-containing protein n=1 Tax=Gordonia sp. (in: high G+C Gram-positive bacteria) TaxID=84139 RepID=UPI0039E55569